MRIKLISCAFCGTFSTEANAIEQGWMPSFWVSQTEEDSRPVCPECAAANLDDLGGDPILKPGKCVPSQVN